MSGISPAPPLPRRFRRLRIVIIGCGDVGLRLVRQYAQRVNIVATSRRADQQQQIRDAGGRAIAFDLDEPGRRRRLEALASYLVYLAPPDAARNGDPRLAASLCRTLKPSGLRRACISRRAGGGRFAAPRRLAYTSTTGVFGDAGGRLLTETDYPNPQSQRAKRRMAAEILVRRFTRPSRTGGNRYNCQPGRGVAGSIFRAPGIYAADRLPLARFERSQPCLEAAADSFSSHIHASDLARILWLGLFRGRAARTYIASDGQRLKMGDYFDQIADALDLPRPPRLSAEQVRSEVSPMAWSFMSESRQLSNDRLTQEFGIRLRYPTVADTLRELPAPRTQRQHYAPCESNRSRDK
ncbi:MAG: SDR family NAD(P)-dependent oxidoreductase [Burkholderiaceae bacterium]